MSLPPGAGHGPFPRGVPSKTDLKDRPTWTHPPPRRSWGRLSYVHASVRRPTSVPTACPNPRGWMSTTTPSVLSTFRTRDPSGPVHRRNLGCVRRGHGSTDGPTDLGVAIRVCFRSKSLHTGRGWTTPRWDRRTGWSGAGTRREYRVWDGPEVDGGGRL